MEETINKIFKEKYPNGLSAEYTKEEMVGYMMAINDIKEKLSIHEDGKVGLAKFIELTNKLYEDINDNLSTKGKRYYMSHSEYVYTKEWQNKFIEMGKPFEFNEPIKLSQLVCATNMELARKAVTNQLEKSGEFLVLKCRIDYLIVGE